MADTHYYRVLTYTPEGKLLDERTVGGTMGPGPGEFGFVTDAVRDAEGNYFVGEYGEYDRIQKLSPDGKYMLEWGGHGSEPGQFMRPQHLEIDADGLLWVTDSCNHRIQVFDRQGKLVKMWGEAGSEPGQLQYPYCLILDGKGTRTCASTATTACRSLHSMASRWRVGARSDGSRGSSTTRGRWCSIAAGGATCWIR